MNSIAINIVIVLFQVATAHMNTEKKMQMLQQLYEEDVEVYRRVIDRMKTFAQIF